MWRRTSAAEAEHTRHKATGEATSVQHRPHQNRMTGRGSGGSVTWTW